METPQVAKTQKPWQDKVDYDYMLWIDSDIIFQVEDFIKLYNLQKEVASGLYLMHNGQQYATVENWNEEHFNKTGFFEFLSPNNIKSKTKPFKVDYTGFGFMLVKKGVFERLKYPWFRPLWKKFGNVTEFTMEDVSFCHLVKEQNIDVWIHPEVIVKHEKRVLL